MSPNEFAELTPLAETLNAKTDEVNQTLALLNKKLAALNVGVEVWVGPWQEHMAYQIGYAKVGETWQLATRTCEAADYLNIENEHEWVDVAGSHGEAKPILQASRSQRIKALEVLERLLSQITLHVRIQLDAIERGKRLAAQL